jgi:hypothetical protein
MPFGVKHEGSKWVVYNKNTDKEYGTHNTKEEAIKQLVAIEIAMRKKYKEKHKRHEGIRHDK